MCTCAGLPDVVYTVVTRRMNWQKADDFCAGRGGNSQLAVIHDGGEDEEVITVVGKMGLLISCILYNICLKNTVIKMSADTVMTL